MKTLCNIAAVLSVSLFAWLVYNAMFAMFFVYPRTSIPVAIPPSVVMVHHDGRQIDCLAQDIYFEAGNQSIKGKLWAGQVIIERTRSPHYPDTICGVVFQASQLSWTGDNKDHTIRLTNAIERKAWVESYAAAKLVITGKAKFGIDMTGVTHYHADYVKPKWARSKNFKLVARIGDHMFYRWKKAMIPPNNAVAMR